MNFKVGDKVKFVKYHHGGDEYMGLEVGDIGFIRDTGGRGCEVKMNDGSIYFLLNDEIELVEIDNVNNPLHYTQGKYEVIDVIEDWQLDFALGNAIKYIARAEHKGKYKEDLKKAIWYLQREVYRSE